MIQWALKKVVNLQCVQMSPYIISERIPQQLFFSPSYSYLCPTVHNNSHPQIFMMFLYTNKNNFSPAKKTRYSCWQNIMRLRKCMSLHYRMWKNSTKCSFWLRKITKNKSVWVSAHKNGNLFRSARYLCNILCKVQFFTTNA